MRSFSPYGFYADSSAKDGFQLPFEDAGLLQRFRTDFRLKRAQAPGLSVVIPYPDREEFTRDRITKSAILQYFYPILLGDLVVEVGDESASLEIRTNSIAAVANSLDWNASVDRVSLLNLFSLVDRISRTPEGSLIRMSEPTPARAPDWNVGRFDETTVESLKGQFEKDAMVAVRVPVTIKPKASPSLRSYFDVFVERR